MRTGFIRVGAAGRRLKFAALLCVACNQHLGSTGTDSAAPGTAALLAVKAPEELGERPSPTPIIISWTGTPADGKVDRISGLLQNTTATVQRVELRLTGMAPSGEIAVRSMGSVDVPANSAVPVEYGLSDLPAQSTDLPSAILLSASYQVARPSAAGPIVTQTLQATTPALHVTLDANGRSATALDTATQARANAMKTTAERRTSSSKIYDAEAVRMVDVTNELGSQGELSPPVIVTLEGQRGSGPPGRADSTQGVDE